jgi:hypothetical protein
MEAVKSIYVTKYVRNKEYDEHHSKHPNYALIRKVQGGVIVGFLILDFGGSLPVDCEEATANDAEIIKQKRKKKSLLP